MNKEHEKVKLLFGSHSFMIIGLEDGEDTAYVWAAGDTLSGAAEKAAELTRDVGEHETFTVVEVEAQAELDLIEEVEE